MLSAPVATGLIAVAVALTLVAADRLAARVVTRRIARHVAIAADAEQPPRIRVADFPFLTQFAGGRYRQVDVTMARFVINGIEFSGLTARLSAVQAPLRGLLAGDGLVAAQVTATVTIPLAVLGRQLPTGLTVRARGGDLQIAGTLLRVPVSGTLAVTAESHRLCFTPLVAGRFPALVGFVIAVPGLPDRLQIESVELSAAGLEVRLRGANVALGQ